MRPAAHTLFGSWKPRLFAILLLCILGLGFFCPLPVRAQKAPDFVLNDLAGRPHKLADYLPEQVVLLNFWATWCVPCIKEFPHLQRLQDLYGDRGFQVLTISIDGPDRIPAVSSFIGRYGYTIPVLLDTESQVVALYNPRLNLPFTLVLDRAGRIRYAHQGYSPGDERPLEEKISVLLGESETKPGPKTSVHADESLLLRFPTAGAGGDGQSEESSRLINRLDLTVARGGFLVGARLDTDVAFSPWDWGPSIRLAKRFAQYSTRGFQARAGDFYASLGRGLVFSLLKVFEEEGLDYVIDTTVDGGRISIGSNRLSGEVFGGWIDRREDPGIRDTVIGGSLGWGRTGSVALRFQGVSAKLEPGGEFENRSVELGSLSLDIPDLWGRAQIFGEFSLIRRRIYFAEEPIDGHGLYLGSRWRLGDFSLLLEMKDYRELNFEYSRPPLLESEELDILADQFNADRTDVSAYSARLDYYVPRSRSLFFGKILFLDDHPDDHRLFDSYDREIVHVFGGAEKRFENGGYLHGLAGWRSENDTSVAFMRTDGRTLHYQFNASWPIGRGWSLEADWKHKVFDGRYDDYSEIRSFLSLHKSPLWVASVLYERTTEPAVVFLSGKKNWWAGQVEVRLAGGHALRLFVGSAKGSTKCAGGVCRYFPPFEGVRCEVFLRF